VRKIVVLGVLAFAVVPAASAEDNPNPTRPAALCTEQRAAGNGYGRCVAKLARAAAANLANAARACTAERADASFAAAHGGKSFAEFYGAGENGRSAFGRCVSQKARLLTEEQRAALDSAVKACETERDTLGAAAFAARYGKRGNAFAKCVRKGAHAQP
jgi:hypothetical protein